MGSYNSVVTMKSLKIISSLSLILSSSTLVSSINFPGLSDTSSSSPFSSSAVSADTPAVSVNNGLVFGRNTFTTASCTDDGVALNTIILNIGEGRVFQSPNYPSAYPNGQTCTYNFEPASGAQLKFSCTDMDLTATSAAGDLCTGDYLRFYDESGQLGQSGERYCFTNKPDFTYTSNIKVLFKTNNDAQQGKGFDCQVVAEALQTTTTTTTTTTPAATDCVTIDGPGATKPCKEMFSYGYGRFTYKGCINQETPGQYLTVVPSFGDNDPAPQSSAQVSSLVFSSDQVSLGTVSPLAPRSTNQRSGSEDSANQRSGSQVVRTLFWCATETDADGHVSEWGKCAAGCKADPAGSYLPAAPRSAAARPDITVGELVDLIQHYDGPQ